jgi:hypothetical protein
MVDATLPLVLRASRRHALAVFAACQVFAAGGIWMLARHGPEFDTVGPIVFFGGASLLFLWMALDPRPQLVLDEAGIWDRRLRAGTIPWERIDGAWLSRASGCPILCLAVRDVEELFRGPARLRSFMHRASNQLGFGDVCISLEGLDAKPEMVLELVGRRLR